MKQSSKYKILSALTLTLTSLCAFAQTKEDTVQIGTLGKVIGIAFTIGGFYMGYMQLKMAVKLAEVEVKFNAAITQVKEDFANLLRSTEVKLEDRIVCASKEIEVKMATRHDIDNIKTISKLQHENTNLQLDGLKEQLRTAANIYRRDKE